MARAMGGGNSAYLSTMSDREHAVDVERLSRKEQRVYLKRRLRQLDANILMLARRLNDSPLADPLSTSRSMYGTRNQIDQALQLDYLLVTRNRLREILEVLECRRRPS